MLRELTNHEKVCKFSHSICNLLKKSKVGFLFCFKVFIEYLYYSVNREFLKQLTFCLISNTINTYQSLKYKMAEISKVI